jgi:hypothetical protein
VNLARVARPWNQLRIVLVTVMTVAFGSAFLMPWSRDLFELPVTEPWTYAMAAAVIAASVPLLAVGQRLAARH